MLINLINYFEEDMFCQIIQNSNELDSYFIEVDVTCKGPRDDI